MNFVDHYITNTRYSRESHEVKCPECETIWTVEGFVEFGRWSPSNEDHLLCADCNIQADIE